MNSSKQALKFIVFIFLGLVILFTSCQTLKNNNSQSYEVKVVPLENDNKNVEIDGFVPVFLDEKLSGFNMLISDFKDSCIDKYISEVEESWNLCMEEVQVYDEEKTSSADSGAKDFFYILTPIITEGNDFVSVSMIHSNYTGGAHSGYWTNTFTWNVTQNCQATIYDVTGYSKEEISKTCIQKIREEFYADQDDEEYKTVSMDWVISGAGEDQVDAMKFYVDRDSVFVRFDPYEVGPWAMGECIIQIK